MSIEDDGMGLTEEGVQQRLGILGLDERIQDLGGDPVIRNRPPGGVFLGASIPVRKS